MLDMKDKVAIITGGTGGIGSAIAKKLGARGARIAINYLHNALAADALIGELAALDVDAIAIKADVASVADNRRIVDETVAHFGRLDILINNVGYGAFTSLSDLTEEIYEQVFSTNVKAALFAMQAALPHLPSDGRIINMSSAATVMNVPPMLVYAASKAALEHLTIVAAKELGPRGITVNVVMPGATRTDAFIRATPEPMQDTLVNNTMLRRLGEPDDVADIVAFVVSDEGRWLTGQIIRATGGLA